MIYPLVIHPDFFHSIYGKEIPKNFNKFYQKLIYDDSHRESFLLMISMIQSKISIKILLKMFYQGIQLK